MVDAAVSGTQPPSEASNPTLDWVAGRWQHYEALWRAATAWAPPSAGYAGVSLRLAARGDMDGAALAQWAHDVNATSAMLRRDTSTPAADSSSIWSGLPEGLAAGRGARASLDAARESLQRRVPGARLSSAFHIKDFSVGGDASISSVGRNLVSSTALVEAARELFASRQPLLVLGQGALCVFEAVLVASAEELGDVEGATVRLREELVLTSWMGWRTSVVDGAGAALLDAGTAQEALATGAETLRGVLMSREAVVFDALMAELVAGYGAAPTEVAPRESSQTSTPMIGYAASATPVRGGPGALGPTW